MSPATIAPGPPRNILTVDVEDYYQVSAFDVPGKRERWSQFESRVCANTDRLLALFADHRVRGTFFVLGWVAERFPEVVRRIADGGHELASHGYGHQLVYDLDPSRFRADVRRSREVIEQASGIRVTAYRAPSFSITRHSTWAIDVLIEEGFTCDSSVFPVARDRYGMPGAPRQTHRLVTPAGSILEVPPTTVRVAGVTVPVAGGGYFRLYPFAVTAAAIRRVNRVDHAPAVVYVHPWEIDPAQPRQHGSVVNRFRHYVGLAATEARLRRLLTTFAFGPMSEVCTSPVRTVEWTAAGSVLSETSASRVA